jgi:hypothetical protein
MQQDKAFDTPFGAQSATCQHWMGVAGAGAPLLQPMASAAQVLGAKLQGVIIPPRQQVPAPEDARQSSAPPSEPSSQ